VSAEFATLALEKGLVTLEEFKILTAPVENTSQYKFDLKYPTILDGSMRIFLIRAPAVQTTKKRHYCTREEFKSG